MFIFDCPSLQVYKVTNDVLQYYKDEMVKGGLKFSMYGATDDKVLIAKKRPLEVTKDSKVIKEEAELVQRNKLQLTEKVKDVDKNMLRRSFRIQETKDKTFHDKAKKIYDRLLETVSQRNTKSKAKQFQHNYAKMSDKARTNMEEKQTNYAMSAADYLVAVNASDIAKAAANNEEYNSKRTKPVRAPKAGYKKNIHKLKRK